MKNCIDVILRFNADWIVFCYEWYVFSKVTILPAEVILKVSYEYFNFLSQLFFPWEVLRFK